MANTSDESRTETAENRPLGFGKRKISSDLGSSFSGAVVAKT